jgi:Bacterial PH domain
MGGVSRSSHLRFRQPGAILVAAAIATVSALPLAGQSWYLAPVILVPLFVTMWAWRSGTDVGRDALRIRALFGQRIVPWAAVTELVPDRRGRVSALLTGGNAVRLPGVYANDLPVIVAATGHSIERPEETAGSTAPEATDVPEATATDTTATDAPATDAPATDVTTPPEVTTPPVTRADARPAATDPAG